MQLSTDLSSAFSISGVAFAARMRANALNLEHDSAIRRFRLIASCSRRISTAILSPNPQGLRRVSSAFGASQSGSSRAAVR